MIKHDFLGLATKTENNKITNTNSSNTLHNKQLTSSSTATPQSASIPQKIKTEEISSSRRTSTTTKENESIKMDILSSPTASSLLNNLKKNQSILDIKMDAAKVHHQHIMLNMLRNTPITAKNFYKVIIIKIIRENMKSVLIFLYLKLRIRRYVMYHLLYSA